LIGGVMDNKNNDNYKKHNKGKFDLPFMVFLIICIPILVINLIIIIRGNMNLDRVPDVFGYKPFAVVSGSMETSINVGDLVIVRKIDSDKSLKNGDIIAFRTSDNYVVTHRIVETKDENGKRYFTTKGDNNKSNDMDPVAFDKIEGVYVTKYSKLGNFVLFIQKPIGFVVIMIIILLIGVILIIVTGKSKSRVISDDELKAFEEFKRNRNK